MKMQKLRAPPWEEQERENGSQVCSSSGADLEHDHARQNGQRSEHHEVNGGDHRRVERIKSLRFKQRCFVTHKDGENDMARSRNMLEIARAAF